MPQHATTHPHPDADVRVPQHATTHADPDTADTDAYADVRVHADPDADADQSGAVQPGTLQFSTGTDTEHVLVGHLRADAVGYRPHAAHLGQRDRLGRRRRPGGRREHRWRRQHRRR